MLIFNILGLFHNFEMQRNKKAVILRAEVLLKFPIVKLFWLLHILYVYLHINS